MVNNVDEKGGEIVLDAATEKVCECERKGTAEFSEVRVAKGADRWEFEVTLKYTGGTHIYGLPGAKYCPWCGGLLGDLE